MVETSVTDQIGSFGQEEVLPSQPKRGSTMGFVTHQPLDEALSTIDDIKKCSPSSGGFGSVRLVTISATRTAPC